MEGLGAHHLSLFNIPTIKKLIKVGQMWTYWFDWLIPENTRWEKVLGLFVPRWLTYSTGSFLLEDCRYLSITIWPNLIHKSSRGPTSYTSFSFHNWNKITSHLKLLNGFKISTVSRGRHRSEIALPGQVLLTLWLTWWRVSRRRRCSDDKWFIPK